VNMRRLIDAIAARNSRYPIGAMLRFNEELRTIGRVADPVAQRPLSLPTAERKADVATGPIRWNGDSLVAVRASFAWRLPFIRSPRRQRYKNCARMDSPRRSAGLRLIARLNATPTETRPGYHQAMPRCAAASSPSPPREHCVLDPYDNLTEREIADWNQPRHATLRIELRRSLEASVRILRTCAPHRSRASLRSARKSWR
jgi:hypothetical protein